MPTGLPETWLAYAPTLKDRSYADFRELCSYDVRAKGDDKDRNIAVPAPSPRMAGYRV
jgi:hypothetical protein